MSGFNSFPEESRFSSSSIATAKRFDSADDCIELAKGLTPNLKAVCFSGNTYSEDACHCVSACLEKCPDLTYVDCSDMFTTRLKTVVPPALKSIVNALEKTSIQTLDVSDNALGGPGTASVVKLIPKPSFTALRINNCGIGTAGALVLTNTFRNLSGIESIKIEDVEHEDLKEILEDMPTEKFITEDRSEEIPLEILVIGRNRLKVDGAEALSYGLPHLKNLKEIYLASNSIPTEGLVFIINSLHHCTNLEVLDINDNGLKPEGVSALVELIKKLSSLRKLNVGDCLLEEDGSLEMLNALLENAPLLEALDMTYNEISDEGAELVIQLLKSRKNLKSLEMNGNCFSKEMLKKLNSALSEHEYPDALGTMSDNEDDDDDEDGGSDDDVDELTGRVSKLSV